MDPNVKPQTLVETSDQANFNSIPEFNVALITLLSYPVSTCTAERSFSGMKRLLLYEENSYTKDHDRRETELSCNSAHTQAQGRN